MIMVSCGPSRGPKKIKTVSVSSKQSLLATPVVIWTPQEEATAHRAMQLFRNHDRKQQGMLLADIIHEE